ncbi:LacI family DNA-binding transcriptional regulator [Clostridium botulinum]|uniref:LacI family DNA-binding transcriptional regulator n=1 Tax=Clostridium botulinum TaxID=1491 RepID=UPI001FAF2E24|nr:helix-turn-helix domain-containing protein [Clostridium botulinum]
MGKVTMKDIAAKLNISINAVSLALNGKPGVSEETKKLVLDVAEKIGYLDRLPKFIQ